MNDGTGQVFSRSQMQELVASHSRSLHEPFLEEFNEIVAQDQTVRNLIGIRNCDGEAAVVAQCEQENEQRITHAGATLFNSRIPIAGIDEAEINAGSGLLDEAWSNIWFLENRPAVGRLLDSYQTRLDDRLIPIKQRNIVRDQLFPKVKQTIVSIIRQLPESRERDRMIARIERMDVQTEFCGGRDSALWPNAYYNRITNRVNMCLNLLFRSNSLFAIVRILGHEVAHSIDPCGIIPGRSFQPLAECLMREESGQAGGCGLGRGQVDEAFCDWMGNEVLANFHRHFQPFANLTPEQFSIGLANSHPFCFSWSRPQSERDLSRSHPHTQDRLNMIAAHPDLRARMGCTNSSTLNHCPLEGAPDYVPPADPADAIDSGLDVAP